MEEVAARLCFTQPSLGAARRHGNQGVIFCMDRAPGKQVMFLPTAWGSLMRYAAKVANRDHNLVKKIDWDPLIVGPSIGQYKRTVVPTDPGRKKYFVMHEAFLPGHEVDVHAVLPDGLEIEDFKRLLQIAGTYKGISPFHNDTDRYGTFEVLSVAPRYGNARDEQIA